MPPENEGLTVELDENGNKPAEAEKKPEAGGEKQYVTLEQLEEIRKQLNGLSYIGRKFNDVDSKLNKLLTNAPTSPKPIVDPSSVDPDDVLLEKDWKAAVRKQARAEAENMFAEQRAQSERERVVQESKVTLEKSKKSVIDRYPDIMDNSSEISQRYTRIINENPEYLNNDYGPILTMRDMEDELRKEGRLDEFSKKAVDIEVQRRARADGASASKGSSGNGTKSISLTPEQKAAADSMGIKYEAYAKVLSKNLKEGVEF